MVAREVARARERATYVRNGLLLVAAIVIAIVAVACSARAFRCAARGTVPAADRYRACGAR
jgi:hypothetical protein